MQAAWVLWLNYALIVQFVVLAVGWFVAGDRMQALYWIGAALCTSGVAIKL